MAKTREIVCKFYVCKGQCERGRLADFYGQCQHCNLYEPLKGARPRRKNLRREKKEKIANDRREWE